MNTHKIAGLLGLLVALLAGIGVAIPMAPLLLLVIGLVTGWDYAAEHHVRVIVSALALTTFSAAFAGVPEVGGYLRDIVGNFGVVAQGAALTIVFKNIYNRFKP